MVGHEAALADAPLDDCGTSGSWTVETVDWGSVESTSIMGGIGPL